MYLFHVFKAFFCNRYIKTDYSGIGIKFVLLLIILITAAYLQLL